MTNNNNRYDYRILGENVRVTYDSRVSGSNNNTLVIGGTGSCKTGGYIYSNLKELNNQSAIISDSKGILYRLFAKELKEKGYDVFHINFIDWTQSDSWNPFSFIRIDEEGHVRYQDVITISKALIPTSNDREPIWEDSARQVLQFLIGYIFEALPECDWCVETLIRLYHILIKQDGLEIFRDWVDSHQDSFPARKFAEIEANIPADKMWSSILGFVNVSLTPFMLTESKSIFRLDNNTIDLRQLGNKKTVLFCSTSDDDHSFDGILNLLFTQCISILFHEADKNLDGRLKVPVNIYLDDFAATYNLPEFTKIISVTRSRDIALTLILQGLSQINTMFGEDGARTILDNCGTILYTGGSMDIKTAEFFGTHAYKPVESIFAMPRDMQYVLETGNKARLVRKIPPYQYECTNSIDIDA